MLATQPPVAAAGANEALRAAVENKDIFDTGSPGIGWLSVSRLAPVACGGQIRSRARDR
jgi:hypothetical protein